MEGALGLEGDAASIGCGGGTTAGVEGQRTSRPNEGFGLAILPSGGHARSCGPAVGLQRIVGAQRTGGDVALLPVSAAGNEGTAKVRVAGRGTNDELLAFPLKMRSEGPAGHTAAALVLL